VYSLGELADRLGLTFTGDPDRVIDRLATLANAGPTGLAFLANPRYQPQLARTRAAAVILHPDDVERCPVDCLVAESPYLAFARATHLFDNAPLPAAGVHPSAIVSPEARVDPAASIAAGAIVEAGAVVAAGALVGPGVYLGAGCHLGPGTRIHANAVVHHGVWIGENCIVHAQAVLGSDGFGFARDPEGWTKICQLGGLRIGDRVEIGAGTTVDRGTLDDTVIGDDVIIDNQVQIAHNCRIGKNTAIAGCTGLAGSTIIGDNCTLAGGVGVVGHVEICDGVHITGMTMVTRSISEPGSYSSGTPMTGTRDWKRSAVRFSQLESIQQRLVNLEKGRER